MSNYREKEVFSMFITGLFILLMLITIGLVSCQPSPVPVVPVVLPTAVSTTSAPIGDPWSVGCWVPGKDTMVVREKVFVLNRGESGETIKNTSGRVLELDKKLVCVWRSGHD